MQPVASKKQKETGMNLSNPVFNQRLLAAEVFNQIRSKASRELHVTRLFSPQARLADFSEILPGLSPNRRYAGIQNIPVEQIDGSVGRPNDFDSSFRPLKAHLRDRWVSNYLHMQAGNLETIRVYKAGCHYFVVDGHHRVSVARATGMAFIQAEVWEYQPAFSPLQAQPAARSMRPVPTAYQCEGL
jgi:hypothetical protein